VDSTVVANIAGAHNDDDFATRSPGIDAAIYGRDIVLESETFI
jgi:hypothetical protein